LEDEEGTESHFEMTNDEEQIISINHQNSQNNTYSHQNRLRYHKKLKTEPFSIS
jgi:hypothetical protein